MADTEPKLNTDPSVDKMTKVYLKMRAAKAKLAAEFKKADDDLGEKMDAIKLALLDYCKQHNVESVRTSEGLFYRTVKTRYWTSDWASMHAFILEHEVPDFLEKRLNQGVVKEFLESNPDVAPPGLNTNSEYTLSVRKA
jgi:succinylglutamate desuccinylase